MSYGYLKHHGIKGQKWGVRRYQNPDGSLTPEGKERYMYANRSRRAFKTKDDMDRLYSTLSKEDKKLLGDDDNRKEWLNAKEGEWVVKRFIKKNGDVPVAALDIMTSTKDEELVVSIMTDPKYRGSGEASKLAKKSVDWFDKNAEKYGATTLSWDAYVKNAPSRHIAEETGFTYDKKSSNAKGTWVSYKRKASKK